MEAVVANKKPFTVDGVDAAQALRKAFFETSGEKVFEVRVIPKKDAVPAVKILTGYFKDLGKACEAVKKYEGKRNIYFTFNAIDQDLYAKAPDRLLAEIPATKDADILKRDWIFFDIDPAKAQKNESATDAEKAEARKVAENVLAFYKELGGNCIFADSGNGFSVFLKVDLPNDAESTEIVRGVLRFTAWKFNTAGATVDLAVSNASRICKLYGTTAVKGNPTKDRPHRQSKILEIPANMDAMPVEALKKLCQQTNAKAGRDDDSGNTLDFSKGRNVTFTSLAGSLHRKGLPEDLILQMINIANGKLPEPLPESEIKAIVRSVSRYPVAENADEFFIKGKFQPVALASHLMENYSLIWARNRLHIYIGGVYDPNGTEILKKKMAEILRTDYRERHATEVLNYLKTKLWRDVDPEPEKEWICLENGLIHWRTGDFTEHTPEKIFFSKVPVKYDPEARCPKIEKFFKDVLPEDCVGLAFELFGLSLVPISSMQKAVLLIGTGSNGKSVFLELLRNFIGVQNCSAEPLQRLSENRFSPFNLIGKLLNICGDLEAKPLKEAGMFKLLVAGEPIAVERKGEQGFAFKPYARLFFSANTLPRSLDTTDGFFRRLILIRFPNSFIKEAADPNLLQKLTTPEELSGLLNKTVQSLRVLMGRGHFEEPESAMFELSEYWVDCDPLALFVTEACELDPANRVKRSALYQAYGKFCQLNGYKPLASRKFTQNLEIYGISTERTATERFLRGVGVIDRDLL